MNRKGKRQLSELEGAVLGVVHQHSPCTAYSVRKVFNTSPVHHWQASAGAIYPVMERLQRERFLVSQEVARGRQPTRQYSATDLGLKTLRDWLVGSGEQLLVPPDPLRTRIFFLEILEPEARRELLQRPLELLREKLQLLEDDCNQKRRVDAFGYLAARGALLVAQARVEWIEEVLDELGAEDT